MQTSRFVPKEAVVLAGGRGTRLSSVLPNIPKPIAPVAGTPFLAYIVRYLQRQGIERILISTGYLAESIEKTLKGEFPGGNLEFCVEPEPLGTGGGLAHVAKLVREPDFLALNGDTFFPIDLESLYRLHLEKQADITIALRKVEDTGRYDRVQLAENLVQLFGEKGGAGPGLINAGTYILQAKMLLDDRLPKSFSFEKMLVPKRTVIGTVAGMEYDIPFIDLGVPEDFLRAQMEVPRVFSEFVN